jgi:hypothetical protein
VDNTYLRPYGRWWRQRSSMRQQIRGPPCPPSIAGNPGSTRRDASDSYLLRLIDVSSSSCITKSGSVRWLPLQLVERVRTDAGTSHPRRNSHIVQSTVADTQLEAASTRRMKSVSRLQGLGMSADAVVVVVQIPDISRSFQIRLAVKEPRSRANMSNRSARGGVKSCLAAWSKGGLASRFG